MYFVFTMYSATAHVALSVQTLKNEKRRFNRWLIGYNSQCHRYVLAMFLPISFIKISSFDTSKNKKRHRLTFLLIQNFFVLDWWIIENSSNEIVSRLIGFEKRRSNKKLRWMSGKWLFDVILFAWMPQTHL